ncbi:MAG TPA: glycosyltransferase family A protein [Nevskiaceae bacterium]|nr:glycosyltransferase family A protein [Nevskiaceae bacterium]
MTVPTVPLAIVSPVRDEAAYVRRILDSMVAQTVRPCEWLFVDDGSRDDTRAIIEAYAAHHPWIRVIRRADRGRRQVGAGVIAAFDEGRAQLQSRDYRYLAKLDGDLSIPPRYLEIMLARLAAEPDLAAVSGKVFRPEGGREVEEFMIDEQVAGQFKLYKREAFEAIGGFTQTPLWDGIDMHRCRLHGWRTLSFHHPQARIYHHRLMGSSEKSIYEGRKRLGRALWFVGYHPLYALASGVFRMAEKPRVIGGLLMLYAYTRAALTRQPQFEDVALRRELRRWQLERLRRLPGFLRRQFGRAQR